MTRLGIIGQQSLVELLVSPPHRPAPPWWLVAGRAAAPRAETGRSVAQAGLGRAGRRSGM